MDMDQIKTLVELMVSHDLSRVEISHGETHILLRRGQPVVMSGAYPTAAIPAASTPSPVASAPAGSTAPSVAAMEPAGSNEVMIRSPMVGTFYASPDPESPPFVNVGSNLSPDTVVCLVEAMKVFNEIKAETSGRVTRVLAKNGQAVEFDQPLFAISPT